MLASIFTIFKKEACDASRDRRSIFLAVIYGIMGPISVMIGLTVSQEIVGTGTQVKVAIAHAERAPGLISHLQGRDIILDTKAEAKLDIPSDYAEKLQSGQEIDLTLTASRRTAERAMNVIETTVDEYNRTLAVQRVILRGVSPTILRPLNLEIKNTDVASAVSLFLAQVMLFYFLVAPGGSGMSLAIDTTAGERERHSLETLLSRPVSRAAIVMGKWITVVCMGMLGVFVCGLVIYVASATGFIANLGVRFDLTPSDVPFACLLVLPFAGLIAALQILAGFSARSFKEAQAYIGFILILPIVLGILASLDTFSQAWIKKMPVFVELAGLKTLLTSDKLSAPGWFIAFTLEIILTIAFLYIATRRLNSGKMLAAD
jgi:sodium transport system permease protein